MKKKILIAPNSYKECADAVTVSNYIEEELEKYNSPEKIILPLSDGGDGFLEVCTKYKSLKILEYSISTPYDKTTFTCQVGYDKINQIIYIESANVLGLNLIPSEKRHPLFLSSKGMGNLFQKLLKDVEQKKLVVKKIIIGIGGTGTNDLGLGLLEEFGLKMKDKDGKFLKIIPANYGMVEQIYWSKFELPFEIEIISDVDNPLLGKTGAAKIFGKQKGLSDDEITASEIGFNKILKSLKNNNLITSFDNLPGAGGGLAAGLKIFFNAKIKGSKIFISEIMDFVKKEDIDFVITGEGAFDFQSISQKATGYLIDIFTELKKTVIVCCGKFDENILEKLPKNVFVIELRKYFRSEEESIKQFRVGIRMAIKEINERFLN